MIILAVDLAFRKTGWVALDTETMAVFTHGTVKVQRKGTLGEQCAKFVEALDDIFLDVGDTPHYQNIDLVAYETPGTAGFSNRRSPGTFMAWGGAQYLLEHYVEVAGPAKTAKWDQAEVKQRIAGRRNASKADVRASLAYRHVAGEFQVVPYEAVSGWSLDETDALAVALCEAQRQKLEVMEDKG